VKNTGLSDIDREILKERFHGRTLQTIAFQRGVTRETIRQRLNRIMSRLLNAERKWTAAQIHLEAKAKEDSVRRFRLATEELEKMRRVPIAEPVKRIEDLNLSIRPYNCLMNACLFDLNILALKHASELMRIRNFGAKCLLELRSEFDRVGIPRNF
jgi:DNA-directed RNA polymerase alpha subunit